MLIQSNKMIFCVEYFHCVFRDLSPISNLKEILLASFSPTSEEIKSAASYALGSVAVGNLQEFLPFILNEIQSTPKRQYLLLHSLKEVCFLLLYKTLFIKKTYVYVNDEF